jgi:hypothetical protein
MRSSGITASCAAGAARSQRAEKTPQTWRTWPQLRSRTAPAQRTATIDRRGRATPPNSRNARAEGAVHHTKVTSPSLTRCRPHRSTSLAAPTTTTRECTGYERGRTFAASAPNESSARSTAGLRVRTRLPASSARTKAKQHRARDRPIGRQPVRVAELSRAAASAEAHANSTPERRGRGAAPPRRQPGASATASSCRAARSRSHPGARQGARSAAPAPSVRAAPRRTPRCGCTSQTHALGRDAVGSAPYSRRDAPLRWKRSRVATSALCC